MIVSEDLIRRDQAALSDVMKLRFYPLIAESAKGAIIRDVEGKDYLDFSAGWGAVNIGYGHPRVLEAVMKTMEKLSSASTISALNRESIELAETLIALTPGDFPKKVWYGHSGSDANEFLAKIVPLASGRPRILTFVGSYHGQTMGSYAMSGHPAQSKFVTGGNVIKAPYPYCYRCAFQKEPDSCNLFCLKYIEDYIFRFLCHPENIGACVVEAYQCDGGDVAPAEGYLQELQAICRKYGIWFIIDEVKVGFGRTGKMFSYENFGLEPDAVVMGKPLGSGLAISAVVGRTELMDAAVGAHLFTTAGNPVACAAGQETIHILQEEQLAENAAQVGNYLRERLVQLKERYEVIADVRGKGLLIGIELVKNRETKEPADELAALVVYRAFELGLLFFYAGVFNNVLEMTPPLIITREQADQAISILEQALQDALDGNVDKQKVSAYAGWA